MIHLHGHSTFSFLDGYGTPDQIAARIKELGHDACAITDHGNVFAHVLWQKAAKAAGIKPIFGCEFYICDKMLDRTKGAESVGANSYPHVTVLAKNQKGYENLLKLSKKSYVEGFYYKPRIDWEELARYQEGLIVLSGCVGGYPSRLVLNRGIEAAWDFLRTQKGRIENLYVELVPQPGLDICYSTFNPLMQIAVDLQLPAIMTADAHFPRREDHAVQDIMLAVGTGDRVNATARKIQLPEYQYYCSEEELRDRARAVSTWATDPWLDYLIANTRSLADQCQVEIPKAKPVTFPKLPLGETAEQCLWRWTWEGAHRRGIDLHTNTQYQERVVYEFNTIRSKGFCDYILAIADVVRYMKEEIDSLVCLRGSAAGSLLLFLLGSSEVDPILHGLSFERFYDASRPDPPDVDIDFERAFRPIAIEYIYKTYGREKCSQISALSKLKAKSALQDAAKAFGIPRAQFVALADALDSADEDVDAQLSTVTDPAALAVLEKYPHLRIFERIVGQYRQGSIHAAGVLISSEALDKVIGVVLGTDKQPVAAVDKKGAAELGFLKMDFLSVSSLDVVANAVRKLGKPMSWLCTLPLNDPKVLKLANSGYLAGVFQLDGGSAARVSKQIGLDSFGDVVAASALCRPGPGDWVPTYKRNKVSVSEFQGYLANMHPLAAEIVRDTFGILLYQEQVMRLAREMAGLEWPQVHRLRKDVADKVGLDPQKGPAWKQEWMARFVGGAVRNGVSEQEAMFWWGSIQTHGGYSFNKSHCVSYGIIGYWMLYLKAYHPGAFYEAYLQLEDDPFKIKRLIHEFQSLGGRVELLHPTFSKASFSSPSPGVLVGGFLNLKGVGAISAQKIMEKGPFQNWGHMFSAMGKAMGARVAATGVGSGQWQTQELIKLAPWFPVPATGVQENMLRKRCGFGDLSCLDHGAAMEGDVAVCGYITATDFKEKYRCLFILEDEITGITVRIPKRMLDTLGAQVKTLQVADYVAVSGWWPGDTLFAKEVILIRRKEDGKPTVAA